VKSKVVDESFPSNPDKCRAIADSLNHPSIFNALVLWILKMQVIKIVNFEFDGCSPLSSKIENCIPYVFCQAVDDEFILFSRLEDYYKIPKSFKNDYGITG
jgi:hypothetical protein